MATASMMNDRIKAGSAPAPSPPSPGMFAIICWKLIWPNVLSTQMLEPQRMTPRIAAIQPSHVPARWRVEGLASCFAAVGACSRDAWPPQSVLEDGVSLSSAAPTSSSRAE